VIAATMYHRPTTCRSDPWSRQTWLYPTRIMDTDVSFENEMVRKNTGTSTLPTAETH